MSKNILILGVNGFIGNSLTKRLLDSSDWNIYGMDMESNKLEESMGNPRFHFVEGDITINKEWIAYHIKKCDVVLPLVAIANPAVYVSDPIRVFELDFEANLEIVRQCVKYKKHIIFPSTSEVYGMGEGEEFDEETSNCILGPINKQRWIYSCSKQLIDRVIYAYGVQNDLSFTLFRPFNWLGPKLDSLTSEKEGSARVVTQFISNILYHGEIKLVNGGSQRRSFTDIDDGTEALFRIIENKNDCASGGIFNIGNPNNDISIKELAEMLVEMVKEYPAYRIKAENTKLTTISGYDHYGKYYEDTKFRKPSIERAKSILGWQPTTTIRESLRKTLDYHLERPAEELVA